MPIHTFPSFNNNPDRHDTTHIPSFQAVKKVRRMFKQPKIHCGGGGEGGDEAEEGRGGGGMGPDGDNHDRRRRRRLRKKQHGNNEAAAAAADEETRDGIRPRTPSLGFWGAIQ